MNLHDHLRAYRPANAQEARDQAVLLRYVAEHPDCLSRDNLIAHVTVSAWTVNPARTRTLLVYHNLYDSWAWVGGHADGESDLAAVALRELEEETGVRGRLVSRDVFSLETLPVEGHEKRGEYVPSHLHLNVTYLAEADEGAPLTVKPDENRAVRWWLMEEALRVSTEPWFAARVYPKLIARCREAPWR